MDMIEQELKVGDVVNFARAFKYRFVKNGILDDTDKLDGYAKDYIGKVIEILPDAHFPVRILEMDINDVANPHWEDAHYFENVVKVTGSREEAWLIAKELIKEDLERGDLSWA